MHRFLLEHDLLPECAVSWVHFQINVAKNKTQIHSKMYSLGGNYLFGIHLNIEKHVLIIRRLSVIWE